MKKISTLGIDLAKSSFTICGLDQSGKQVIRKELKRDSFAEFGQKLEPCRIVMEACGTSHFWSRKFLSYGHDVKIIAPQKVVGFRKCNKNDHNDAYAIAIAASCPGMEFVGIKSIEQQDIQSVIRLRSGLIKRQTALANEMRGLLAEYGLAVPEGLNVIRSKLAEISSIGIGDNRGLTGVIVECVKYAHEELTAIAKIIEKHETLIRNLTKEDDRCRRLQTIPGVGPLTAATIVSTVVDPKLYKNGRQFAASIGLTPRHVQTGGKDSKPIQLGISKHGDPLLRSLLVQGGMTVAAHCNTRHTKKVAASTKSEKPTEKGTNPNQNALRKDKSNSASGGIFPSSVAAKKRAAKKVLSHEREDWIIRLVREKGLQKTAVAIANRNARIIHSILKNGGIYNARELKSQITTVA